MQDWRSYTPAVRREVTEAMLRQADRIRLLLDELEDGRVLPGDLDALHVRRLVGSGNAEIRARSRTLLEESLPEDRQQALARYRPALDRKGDSDNGRAVFQKNCAVCHRIADLGVNVGPDISDTRVKTPEALLNDILNPNQAIDSNYVGYVIATRDGNVIDGVIAAETASSVTLRRAEDKTDVILRRDIEEIRSTGKSLMPEGLEKDITLQEMADLITFLKNWRYLDGAVPLGTSTRAGDEQP